MKLRLCLGFWFFFCSGCLVYGQVNTVDHWESVVYASDTWRYFVATSAGPAAGWQNPGFNDASWVTGSGGFGYTDGDDATVIAPPNPYAVYIRTAFSLYDTSQIAMALFNMDFDDGFVAWINGVEIARANLGIPGDNPDYNTPAGDHEAVMYQGQKPPSYLIYKQKLRECLVNGSNILAVQVNNSSITSSDMTCIPYLSVGLTTSAATYRPVPAWFTVPYTGFSGSHLPLLLIETNGSSIQADVKVTIDLGIISNDAGAINYLLNERNDYNGKAGIEYRGSSSMMFPKRNYGFETRTQSGIDTAVSLLGLPPETDWVLHGPYSDKSLMRNYLAYYLARAMGHYAPRTRFCELFVDGQYHGLYVLIEKIKRDSLRVDIARLDSSDLTGNDLTGGYIVKIDRSADGSYTDGWFSPYRGTGTGGEGPFFAYHYPKRDNILPVQKNYIRNRITAFESTLIGSQFKDPYTGYRKYIDVGSFIDYFLLVELSKNTDGFRLSTFLYKNRDDKDPLIHMGPVWDYDLAFGNADYLEAFNTYGWNYTVSADGWGTPFWWSRLLSDPYFANQVNCRWQELRQNELSDQSIEDVIDAFREEMGDAIDRNFVQWPIHGQYVWPNPYVGNTYEQDINYMKNWINERLAWIDGNIPGTTCATGLEPADETRLFSVRAYPNPAMGEVNLEIVNSREGDLSVSIFSVTGQLVHSDQPGSEAYLIKRIHLNPGIYTARITSGSETQTLKLIIQ